MRDLSTLEWWAWPGLVLVVGPLLWGLGWLLWDGRRTRRRDRVAAGAARQPVQPDRASLPGDPSEVPTEPMDIVGQTATVAKPVERVADGTPARLTWPREDPDRQARCDEEWPTGILPRVWDG